MKRRLNLLAVLILLATTSAASAAVYFVHKGQVERNIHVLVAQAAKSEQAGDLAKARESLRRYLIYRRDDGPSWKRYAQVMDRLYPTGPSRGEVFLAYEQALRLDPDDLQLRRKSADLALALQRFTEARRHYTTLLEKQGDGEESRKLRAELEDALAQCDAGQSKPGEAEARYRKALADDPVLVDTYDRLARLLRTERGQPEAADKLIDEMVAANPTVGRAYLLRWQYRREFLASADPADARKAHELAPQDPESILAAAIVAEEAEDTETARKLLVAGQALAPNRAAFPSRLARLELVAGRPAEAEKILRKAQEQLPGDVEIAFLLTDNLIVQGKIDGKDEAREWLVKLREMNINDGFVKYLEGRLAMRKGDWATAIARLNASRSPLARDPSLINQINLLLAQCYQQIQEPSKAIAALERSTNDPITSSITRPVLASLYEAGGQLDKALTIHLALAESRPESRIDIARILLVKEAGKPEPQRDWTEVERRLAEAEKAFPDGSVPLELLRANLLAAQNKLDDARRRLDEAAKKYPKDVDVRLAHVRAAQAAGDNESALKILDQAEKDLGRQPGFSLARFAIEVAPGGVLGRQAIGTLDADRQTFPAEEQFPILEALAASSYRLGDREAAIGYWEKMLAIQPANPGVIQLLIDASLETNRLDRVPGLIDRLKALDGPEGVRWRQADAVFRLNLIRRSQAKEESNVLRLAAEIEDRAPGGWVPAALRGQLAETQGQTDQAINEYRKAVELGCTQPNLARQLVALLYQRGEFDTIDQVVATLRKNNAEPADLTLIEAMNSLRRGDVDGALELARRSLPDSSSNALDHVFIGRMLVYAGRYAEAEPSFQRALKLAPTDPDALISYMECLVRMGQPDRARDLLNKTVPALAADRADLIAARGFDLLNDGEAAAKTYDQALARAPNDPATLRAVLDFKMRRGELEQSKELLARFESVGGEAARPLVNRIRSQLLLRSGELADLDQAVALVDQNLRASPLSFDDQKLRAILLSMRPSKREESIGQLEALNEKKLLEPSEQFLLAMLHAAGGDHEAAQGLLTRIVDNPVSRKDPRPLIYFVAFLMDRGDLAEAGRRLEQLRPLLPDSLQVLAFEARLLHEGKKDAEARSLLQAYRENHPDELGPLASLYDQLGFKAEAEQAYRDFAAQDPKQPERLLPLVLFLGTQGKTAEALELCKKLESVLPAEVVAESLISAVVSASQPTDEQMRQVESKLLEFLKAKPDSGALLVQLAVLRAFQQKFDEAESRYREALAREPQNLQALNNLSWLLGFRQPEGTEALEMIDRAIELAGPAPALLDTRAVLRILKGQVDPALEDLRVALANAPEIPVLYLHLAQAQHRAGNIDEARKALQMAEERGLKAESVDPLEREAYARLRKDLMP